MGFHPIYRFCTFCGQPVVTIIKIDNSKTRNSLVGVEVHSPYVIESRSNRPRYKTACLYTVFIFFFSFSIGWGFVCLFITKGLLSKRNHDSFHQIPCCHLFIYRPEDSKGEQLKKLIFTT